MTQRDIVVIGASAGGVAALRSLAAALPAGFPAAVFVVLHVGPHPSLLPVILASSGPNVAAHAVDGEAVRPGRIYIAPPDHHLLLEAGRVQLTRGPKEHHTRPAIDPLFRSAAIAYGPRVVGVVLTGMLDDGTAGLQAIKECGGVAVVQDPLDAECASMPLSAARHVAIDHSAPIAELPGLLSRLVAAPAPAAAPAPPALVREHAVASAALGAPAMDELNTIGRPSVFVCPDCQGTLWELHATQPPRYRCHTGHGFSLRSLQQTLDTTAEEALWSALRALQERATALLRAAEQARRDGAEAQQVREAEAAAEQAERQAQALRALIGAG